MVGSNNAVTPYTLEIANQRLSDVLPLKAKGKKKNEIHLCNVALTRFML